MPHTPISTPDALVIGLGAMGSATVYQLAKLGLRVVGLDQWSPPHAQGSTHGETRITRQAIGEGAHFVQLALRAHVLWREIERATQRPLLTQCGGLVIARAGLANTMHEQRDFHGTTVRAAQAYGIAHEVLDAAALAQRFPQLSFVGDETAYYEPGAGYLAPEACVSAQLTLAAEHGAALHLGERVTAITTTHGRTTVTTTQGTYRPRTTIVCAGPWLPALVPQLAPRLVVRRQVMHWFAMTPEARYGADEFPVFIWQWGPGPDDVFYGMPSTDPASGVRSMKIASEQRIAATTPEAVARTVSADESAALYRTHIQARMPGVTPHCVRSATCLYTNIANANFLIDRLPDAPDLIVVSACSGHGFKHSAAIGEAVAAFAQSGSKPEVLAPFAF
jgi:sarcosine oxidase